MHYSFFLLEQIFVVRHPKLVTEQSHTHVTAICFVWGLEQQSEIPGAT